MHKPLVISALLALLGSASAVAGPNPAHRTFKHYHSTGHKVVLQHNHRHHPAHAYKHRHGNDLRHWRREVYSHSDRRRHSVGAFLLGSALTYSLVHDHHDSSCREPHRSARGHVGHR